MNPRLQSAARLAALGLFLVPLSCAPEEAAPSLADQWVFANDFAASDVGEPLSEVVQACVNPDARYAATFEGRTLLDAYQDRNEFGGTIAVFHMASWTEDSTVVIRFTVNTAEAAIRGETGTLSIIGKPGALEGYNWMFTEGGEPSFAGPSPDTMPFEVPCADAERAAELLNDTLPFLPTGQGPFDIVEASYQGYLQSITMRFPDDRLDPIVGACRAPRDLPRPKSELISGGYDDDPSSETAGRVFVTIVSHDDQSKELGTYFLDPTVVFTRSPEDQTLILSGGDAGASGHTGWISPSGDYSHVGSFEVSDGYADTPGFYCAQPDLASAAVYGLRAWVSAGLPRAPEITYSLRFDQTSGGDVTGCGFNGGEAALTAEKALFAEGLAPQRLEASDPDAQVQFVLTPQYADPTLPDQCHYTAVADTSWDLSDPSALVVNLRTDPIETSFRDLDLIASRVGRDFLQKEASGQEAEDTPSLP